uniref:Uncharacterized protein n=1 Tax=Musca domestica TaxID=7370 RepID=A0A1I8NJX1_MUSDO
MGPPKIQQTNANTPNNSLDRMSTVDTSVPLLQSNNRFDKLTRSPQYETTSNSTIICNSGGKRANRTRFTDYQIKVLQEFFENNSYPKDSDLEYLSKLLLLSPRVIVVWFQNARQKQRKIYENQPNTTHCDNEDKKQNINYTCKRCHLVFQRYYELIRHQKNHCFKEENNKRSAKAQKAAAQIAQHLSSEDSNSSMDQISNTSSSHLPRMSPKGSSSNSATELSHRSSMDMVSLSTAVSANKSSVAESNEQILQLQQNSYMLNENDDESSNKPYVCKRKYSDAISDEYNNFSPSNIHSLSSDHTKVHMPLPYQGIHHQHAEQSILRDTDFLFQYYERNEHVKDAGLEIADKRKPSIEFLLQYYQMMEAHKHLHVEHHQQPIIDQKQTAEDTGSLAVENGKHSPVIEVCRKGSHSVKSTENSHSNYEEDDVRIFRADPVDDTSIVTMKRMMLEFLEQIQ